MQSRLQSMRPWLRCVLLHIAQQPEGMSLQNQLLPCSATCNQSLNLNPNHHSRHPPLPRWKTSHLRSLRKQQQSRGKLILMARSFLLQTGI